LQWLCIADDGMPSSHSNSFGRWTAALYINCQAGRAGSALHEFHLSCFWLPRQQIPVHPTLMQGSQVWEQLVCLSNKET
jgi:hypothetical protein